MAKIEPRKTTAAATPLGEAELDRACKMLDEYQDWIVIDKKAIDDELIDHSQRYFNITQEHALSTSMRDAAKSALERVQAEADTRVRIKLAKDGDDKQKITEAQVKAGIALDSAVMTASARFADWVLLTAKWLGLVNAFEARRRMLESFVRYTIAIAGDSGGIRAAARSHTDAEAEAIRNASR